MRVIKRNIFPYNQERIEVIHSGEIDGECYRFEPPLPLYDYEGIDSWQEFANMRELYSGAAELTVQPEGMSTADYLGRVFVGRKVIAIEHLNA